jgi:predicted nucleotidyltransferase
MPEHVLHINQLLLSQIAAKHHLSLVVLFGSSLTGKTHAKSDIDLAVLPEKKKSLDLLQLYHDLTAVFSSSSAQLDIVNLQTANPLLLYACTQQAKLLFGSPQTFQKIQLKAFRLYQDYSPYFKIESEFVKSKLNPYVTT